MAWDMDNSGALTTGSAVQVHARRLITNYWLRLAHHSPFTARSINAFAASSVRLSPPATRRARLRNRNPDRVG
jgi:hypothetical protein